VQQSPIVEIENVSFGYEAARPVLREVTLAIPRGAVVGIMGQSGCGKTTLLRIIMAAYLPTAGTARVLGAATSTLEREGLYAMRRKMGMLFQFGALFTDMSVYGNVAFPLLEHTTLPAELIHDLVMLSSRRSGCAAPRISCRQSSPAEWRAAWRSHARSLSTPSSCSTTSPSPGSTRSPSASSCGSSAS
jgi:phospholipid/cholesterol/gamma-HCH transport system ATP-binding protein